ncbi:peroxisomal assembly protein [Trapelia coarctata]|nr:peroxisomal assembly protein [Trapelia coarctata]
MDPYNSQTEHRKRRRRRPWRTPISARLTLDERTKGDVGVISEDLFSDLFQPRRGQSSESISDVVHYVAITPWQPPASSLAENCSWTVIPVRLLPEKSTGPSIVRFPASSFALQGFAATVHISRNTIKPKAGFEILVLEVEPLVLDTIFVRVDADALRKHDEVQKRFGGGFHTQKTAGYQGKGKAQVVEGDTKDDGGHLDSTQEDRLRAAIRSSLAVPQVVHRDDLLPLPLPAHPITHVPFPPIKITLCEPVDQGLISGDTKIIIDLHHDRKNSARHARIPNTGKATQRMIAEEDEDTSAEAFYSAVEVDENAPPTQQSRRQSSTSRSSASGSSGEDCDSDSDDSADNMISLSSPNITLQSSGTMSAMAAATPRPLGLRKDGVSTPGSVYSNYTATTARQPNQAPGRLFKLHPLVFKISDDILHPPPNSDEDDEARIFVDVKMLVRLGCFSGDWVKISSVPDPHNSKTNFLPLGAFEGDDSQLETFRVLKIYGLADASSGKGLPQSRVDNGRRSSQASILPGSRPAPSAYVSPILYANLKQPNSITISPLSAEVQIGAKVRKSKVSSSSTPPIVKEVTLLRLPTPLSTERAVQTGLLVNLKQYFERRRRILQKDDLIGILMDVGVSRILAGTGAEPDHELEELFVQSGPDMDLKKDKLGVAWFKVGHIHLSSPTEDKATSDSEIWGGCASIEPMTTRMVQVGSRQGIMPPTIRNPWQYYFGLKRYTLPNACVNVNLSAQNSLSKAQISPRRSRLRELLAAATSPQAHYLHMQPLAILLYSTQRNIGKAYLASSACADLGLHIFPIDAYDILTEGGTGSGDIKTEASFRAKIDRALTCGAEYTVPLLQHAEALTADRMATAFKDVLQDLRALIVTTTEIDKIPESIRSIFTHEIEISAPDEGERERILRDVVSDQGAKLAYDVDLAAIAVKTAALVAGDLVDVVERALVAREERLESLITNKQSSLHDVPSVLIRDLLVSGGTSARCVTNADFDIAVEAARRNFADSIGAPKIPNVSWDDVGGLTNVKDAVMETIQLPLERPELFAKGMKKRSGILFYGPPGTGKTLLAKAIATEFSLNFFSVKGPELLNMYIGESEANVRRVFQRARDARPCVVFFDELDSVAPKRGNQGDSGGVMDRIVSQLLAELDGMSDSDGGGGGVFVIGATNRPDLLDQALLRPGRFDKMLYLGISDTHEKQLTILEALTRKFALHPDTSLRRVAEVLPFTYTGADLYALCSDAMLKAVTRQASAVDAKIKALPSGPVTTAYYFDHYATPEDLAVMVTEEDFYAAQRELNGSVSAKELEHYQRVRRTFEGPERIQSSREAPRSTTMPRIVAPESIQQQDSRPKFKTRTMTKPKDSGKGKGKATQWASDDDEDDEAYVTSNDYGTPARYRNGTGNGKGKEVVRDGPLHDGFQDTAQDDDENLYG